MTAHRERRLAHTHSCCTLHVSIKDKEQLALWQSWLSAKNIYNALILPMLSSHQIFKQAAAVSPVAYLLVILLFRLILDRLVLTVDLVDKCLGPR